MATGVCDPSTFVPWQDEINKFLPSGSFRVIAAADGGQLRRFSLEALQMADVVIVPYPIFRGRSYANLKPEQSQVLFFPSWNSERIGRWWAQWHPLSWNLEPLKKSGKGAFDQNGVTAGNNSNYFNRPSFGIYRDSCK